MGYSTNNTSSPIPLAVSGTHHYKILSHPQVTKGWNTSYVRVRTSEVKGMILPFYQYSAVSQNIRLWCQQTMFADSLWQKTQFLPSSENTNVENEPELCISSGPCPTQPLAMLQPYPSHLWNGTEMPQHLQVKQVRKCYVCWLTKKLHKTSRYLATSLSLNLFHPQLFNYSHRSEQCKSCWPHKSPEHFCLLSYTSRRPTLFSNLNF